MFDISSEAPLCELDDETRRQFIEYLLAHNDYMSEMIKLNDLKIQVLRSQNPVDEGRLADYASLVVAPHRRSMEEKRDVLLKKVVNVDHLKEMAPMFLAAAAGSINIPLLLNTVNLDADQVSQTMKKIRDFVRDGIS